MNHTTTLYGACEDLFARYPLAVKPVSSDGTFREMVLALIDNGEPQFFILTHDDCDGRPYFWLSVWGGPGTIEIEPGTAAIPGEFEDVLHDGIPLPRDGSMFGYMDGGIITTLLVSWTTPGGDCPDPHYMAMPLAGMAEEEWAPFTGNALLSSWFWDYLRDGHIIPLRDLIAGTPGTVFWVVAEPGVPMVAVKKAIPCGGGTLPAGRYVYYQQLRDGTPLLSLEDALADPGRIDLAPRFERMAA